MKLKDALGNRKFVVTSEVQTPLGDDSPEQLVDRLKRIRGRVDGVSVSDVDLEGVVGDSIHTCELLQRNRFNAIYQTTTRDKNRIQLQKDLALAHQSGIENLLVFTEDYRITGDTVQEQMFFHVDAGKLSSVRNTSATAGPSTEKNCRNPSISPWVRASSRSGAKRSPSRAWKVWRPSSSWAPATS